MCGIAGALIFDSENFNLDYLWSVISKCNNRGKESFGVSAWNENSGWIDYRSFDISPENCKKHFENYHLKGLSLYLHTSRAEPTTEWKAEKSELDIPPFRNDLFAVAHNGIISNDHELTDQYHLNRKSPIDTSIIPDLLSKTGTVETLNALRGGLSLGIIDSNKQSLTLCRNFMPLAISWIPGMIVFASEMNYFDEYNLPFSAWHFWEFPHYTILELHRDYYKGPYEWSITTDFSKEVPTRSYPTVLKNGK